jgi:two-component system osmolarity sensor histidine kinase EnvZ
VNIRPASLLGRTAMTIGITLLVFTTISMSAVVYFVMIPMAKRSAEDFAAEFIDAAHALQDLPEAQHPELKRELLDDHGLIVTDHEPGLVEKSADTPYLIYFREALTRNAGEELPIIADESGPMIWVDVPAHGKEYRIGFNRKRLGTNPPLATAAIVGGGALMTLLLGLVEVRRIVKPLEKLSKAVREVGRGQKPAPVAEDGPEEIAELARTINRLSSDINEMAQNRTVMIAGISHDLRTPLTRLSIAVEMLDENSRPQLVAGIRRDLEAMNNLISQFLEFSKEAKDSCPVQVDLWRIVESLAADLKREGAELRLHRHNAPCVFFADAIALERVLWNLLKNAAQYGKGKPIDLALHCSDKAVSIEVCDRGPGIPTDKVEAAFKPFERLQPARGLPASGSGLGLAIVRELATKHGWTIDLLPREGGGTVAKLGLPTTCRFALERAQQPTEKGAGKIPAPA